MITDDQIRELRLAIRAELGTLTPLSGASGTYDRFCKLNHQALTCSVALGERRARAGDSRAKARVRCGEIIAGRAGGAS